MDAGPSNAPLDIPKEVSGFQVLPVSYSADTKHFLYLKAHVNVKKTARSEKETVLFPDGRTLFVVNVPPDATERELTMLFQSCGTVERVVFDQDEDVRRMLLDEAEESEEEEEEGPNGENEGNEDAMEGVEVQATVEPQKKKRKRSESKVIPVVVPLPTVPTRQLRKSGGTAHVVFCDSSSLERALSSYSRSDAVRPWPRSSEPHGLARYMAIYDAQRPSLDAVRDYADSYMRLWDYEQNERKQKSKYLKGEAIVDEDGFTLVTRGGAYGKTLGGGVGVADKKFMERGETGRS